ARRPFDPPPEPRVHDPDVPCVELRERSWIGRGLEEQHRIAAILVRAVRANAVHRYSIAQSSVRVSATHARVSALGAAEMPARIPYATNWPHRLARLWPSLRHQLAGSMARRSHEHRAPGTR